MNHKEYVKHVLNLESNDFKILGARLSEPKIIRLLHASIGLTTESGEFIDALKKYIFYGKPIDEVNLAEELGDLFWYIGLACDELGVDFESVWEKNIAKLKARYPEKFTEKAALNRNLNKERGILEGKE